MLMGVLESSVCKNTTFVKTLLLILVKINNTLGERKKKSNKEEDKFCNYGIFIQ